jgi:putative membrane protein
MIPNNSKGLYDFLFKFEKSDSLRKLLPSMVFIGLYSALIAYIEVEYFKMSPDSEVKNLSIMHSSLGMVISLLLAFRFNSAYDRWWEGRKLWGGVVNNCRNLSLKLSAILNDENELAFFGKVIAIFPFVLDKHLKDEDCKELFASIDLKTDDYSPNQISKLLLKKANDLYLNKKIVGEHLLIIVKEIESLTDNTGACERLKNSSIPYSYSVFMKRFIFIFVMTLPYGYALQLGYYIVPVVVFIFYIFASLKMISEEIENPFGNVESSLQTAQIAKNIQQNVKNLI